MSDKYEGLPPLTGLDFTERQLAMKLEETEEAYDLAFRLVERERQLLSLLQERDQLSAKESPVEPPQWEDYFRALKLSYPENLTAIYVAKEVYSMFMSAPKGESE